MRDYKTSKLFDKNTKKLRGKELSNLLSKIDEILTSDSTTHYKNLKGSLSLYKRVHVNNSFVILFFDKKGVVHFIDYAHHDVVYNFDKRTLKKYKALFES